MPLARFMVECFIGRPLDGRNESVHHKNHDKQDDRIENLSVKSASEHIKELWAEQKKNPTWKNYVFRELTCAHCGKVAQRRGTVAKYCSRQCGWKHWNDRQKKRKNSNGQAEVPGVQGEVQAASGLGGVLLEPMRPASEAEKMA